MRYLDPKADLTFKKVFNDAQLLGYGNFWDAVKVEKALASDAISKGLAEGVVLNGWKMPGR